MSLLRSGGAGYATLGSSGPVLDWSVPNRLTRVEGIVGAGGTESQLRYAAGVLAELRPDATIRS